MTESKTPYNRYFPSLDKKGDKTKGVLVIYTGGTIGSIPKDPKDPDSPQIVIPWDVFKKKTPELNDLGFKVDAYSTEPLDSCNIGPDEWKEMAKVIKESYANYEGFVILHGTDTLVYTASALSFMLQNLGKPVIVTGAQISALWSHRNDAMQNMISAIMIANPAFSKIPIVPEVCIYFNGKLYRGNRCRKHDASGFDAYGSPNYPPLGVAGESITINSRVMRKIPVGQSISVKTRLEPNVIAINIFPGIQDGKTLDRLLTDPNIKGVVLMAYGAGNIPTQKHVLDLVRKATKRGVVVLDVTQCGGGKVELGLYETSALLVDVGVVSGVDITPEAALCKLMVLLGDEDHSAEQAALKAQIALSGEQSLSIHTTRFKSQGACSVDTGMPRYRIPAEDVKEEWHSVEDIERIILRFSKGTVISAGEGVYAPIKLFMNLSSDDELDESSTNFLGTFQRLPNSEATTQFFDITEQGKKVIGKRASFTIVFAGDSGSFQWDDVEMAVYVREK